MRDAKREERENGRMRRVGEHLQNLAQGGGVTGVQEGRLVSWGVRMPTEEEPSTLLVVKAEGEDGKVIGFVGAFSVVDALLAWRAKDQGAGLRWREDIPWSQRGG